MNKKVLYIFIIATDIYNEYMKYFFESLENFILNEFEIKLVIISDNKPKDIKFEFLYYPTPNLPYPFNTYLKIHFIKHAIEYFNLDNDMYIMYVDVDTIIRKLDNYTYFESLLKQNKMIFSISPWYKNQDIIFNENIQNLNFCNECYINNLHYLKYIQSSFFAGQIKSFIEFEKIYYDFVQIINKNHNHVSSRHKVIPSMQDQSIINKLLNENKIDFNIDYLVYNIYNYDFKGDIEKYEYIKEHNNVFLLQKFYEKIKKVKRL